ncbi:Putative malate dehydrogenase 1B [Papilio xuthus]|uniref:Putative malate dehydrogenase 1B n=1 Tax=Papilio xuthus TaxID=66420 RepID=A0A194Q2Y8_PAPXU|nr:Putative malate dehydrogenase 1B [Papilio xuthus]
MSGLVFGDNVFIDLQLLVYSDKVAPAETLKCELEKCAFSNTNSIQVITNLPRPKDADVFCVMSDFENPNYFDIDGMENETQFDTMYLLIKFANHLVWNDDDEVNSQKNKTKPIFVTDGLLAMNILFSLSKNLPKDLFFCLSPIEVIAKSVLGDHLNVRFNQINEVRVWAANDRVFHVEVEKPIIITDSVGDGSNTQCDRKIISKATLQSSKLDYTQFNSTWMRKEFIEKVASYAARNPYGCIYKAAEFAKSLKQIWKARTGGTKVCSNMGVISDGSIGTAKGYPYVLPIIFNGNTWEVNKSYEDNSYLKQEMKRINKAAEEEHQKVLNLLFIS